MKQETRQELMETIELQKKVIASLKCKVGGYVTATKKQKEQIAADAIGIEKLRGDIDAKCKTLEEKESIILDLRSQIIRAKSKAEAIEKAYADCMIERDRYKETNERILGMPWYKRIFLTDND